MTTTQTKTLAQLTATKGLTVTQTPSGLEVRKGKRGVAWVMEFNTAGRFVCAYRADLRDGEVGLTVRTLKTVMTSLGA